MSSNLPSTSGSAGGPAKGSSRVFILTPDMLKKLGLADKVNLLQSRSKPESTVQLVKEPGNTVKIPITPRLIIPSDRVKIIPKKSHDKQPVDVKRRISFDSSSSRLQKGHTVTSAGKTEGINEQSGEKLSDGNKAMDSEGVAAPARSLGEHNLNQIDSFNPPSEIKTKEESSVSSETVISIPRIKKTIAVRNFKRGGVQQAQLKSSQKVGEVDEVTDSHAEAAREEIKADWPGEEVTGRVSEEMVDQSSDFSGIISQKDDRYREVRHCTVGAVGDVMKTESSHQVAKLANVCNNSGAGGVNETARTVDDEENRDMRLEKSSNPLGKSSDVVRSKESAEFKNFPHSSVKSWTRNIIKVETASAVSNPKDNQMNRSPLTFEVEKPVEVKSIESRTNISCHLLSAVSQEVESLQQMNQLGNLERLTSSSSPGTDERLQKDKITGSEKMKITPNPPILMTTESPLRQLLSSDSSMLMSSLKTPDKPENPRKRKSPEVKSEVNNDEGVSPPKTPRKLKPVITDIQIIPKNESPNLLSRFSPVKMLSPTRLSPLKIQEVKKEETEAASSSDVQKTSEKLDEKLVPEKSEKTEVPSPFPFKRKKTRILKLEVSEKKRRARKAPQQKKSVDDVEVKEENPPVLVKETAATPSPIRMSRRAPKLKIFENCITYPVHRRKSAEPNKENASLADKRRRRRSKTDSCSSDSQSTIQSSLNSPIFAPIFEDSDSPRKLVIDESKFNLSEIEEVTLHCDVQQPTEKKSETSFPTVSVKVEEGEDEIDSATISAKDPEEKSAAAEEVEPRELTPVPLESPEKPRKARRRRSTKFAVVKASRRGTRKPSREAHEAASPIATVEMTIENSNPPAVPEENLDDANEINFTKIIINTPETPGVCERLSAKLHESTPEKNFLETPPGIISTSDSQTCKAEESSDEIPRDSADPERPREADESVASAPEELPPVRRGRGRWRTNEIHQQSPVTKVLLSATVSPQSSEVISNAEGCDLTPMDLKTPPQEPRPPPKRRGRKRKSELLLLQPPESREATPPPPDPAEEPETPESRPRKPPVRLDETDGKGLSGSEEETAEIVEQATPTYSRRGRGRGRRGRGRGRGRSAAPTDRDYVPRLAVASTPPAPRPLITSKTVRCAKCNDEMATSAWAKHNLAKHNNMGWREGEEEPDFSDINFLTRFLTKTKKKKSTLVCETCGTAKRSAIGFISHIQFCGKTDEERQALMWTCPICRATFMPSSQEYHERTHREEAQPVKLRAEREAEEKGSEHFLGKRKAAQRAATKISEFTELVKASEDPPKGRQKSSKTVHDFIEQPALFKKIPNVWKGSWKRAIDSGQLALCRQPGCTFSTSKIETILEHYSQCNFTPKTTMTCKICKFFSESQEEMEKHVKDEHADKITAEDSDFVVSDTDDSENAGDDADQGEAKVKRFQKLKVTMRSKFLLDGEAMQTARGNVSFIGAFQWTLDFEKKHYRFQLFEDLKPNIFSLLQNPENYLPQLKTSMAVTHVNSTKKPEEPKDWKRWRRFESAIVDNIPTMFAGGPVWALAWLPLPTPLYDRKLHQYIAVSTHPTMESSYEVGQSYEFKNSIQIWDLGHLTHEVVTPAVPKLCYLVAHEAGTVWSLQWCPSGAYQHEDLDNLQEVRRMGLLAAATSSGLVHIYALPFPEDVETPEADASHPMVFKTNPVMTLHVNSALEAESGTNTQCMTLSWSKTEGHDTLAAGFSNGFVAVWELNTKSPLLRSREGSTVHLEACRHFYAHWHAVMFVSVIPFGERRYLATAGMDRCSKVWDLEETSTQLWCLKRGVAVNGAWMTHWPAIVTAYDDVLGLSHTHTYLASFRDISNRVMPVLPTNSTTYGLDVSDWGNAICHGTLAGEIVTIFPPQLLYLREIDKLSRKRWLVSNVDVVDLGEKRSTEGKQDYEYMPESYEKCQDRFGIAFHDDVDNVRGTIWRYRNKKRAFLNSETMTLVPVEQYPFAAVNRVVWNPNAWSYLCLATGYQNGLIRILNLRKMSINSIIHDNLAEHAKSMMDRVNKFQDS